MNRPLLISRIHAVLWRPEMRMREWWLLFATAALVAMTLSACSGGGGQTPTSPPPSFTIQTVFRSGTVLVANPFVTGRACQSNAVGIFPVADVANCIPSNHGVNLINWSSGSDGKASINNNVFPVSWEFEQNASSNCNVPTTQGFTVNNSGEVEMFPCTSFPYTTISPGSITAGSEPAWITISGPGINNQYGTPQVRIYNEFGYVVASADAANVDAVNSTLTVATPGFTGLLDGTYAVVVGIFDSGGTLQPTLGTDISISGYYSPPPDPGGGDGCTRYCLVEN
jgi:hypothetical protein